jgi:hypothetical protein
VLQHDLVRHQSGKQADPEQQNAQIVQLLAAAPVGIVAGVEYRDGSLQLKFKAPPDAQLQNLLRAQAVQQGLQLRFEADGAARVSAAGG